MMKSKKHEEDTKIKELENSYKRLAADFDNYRKRTETQKLETIELAKADFLTRLTPVLDNFRRAFKEIPEEIAKNDWAGGIEQIEKQLLYLLKEEGLEKIPTEKGLPFDPNLHEAITCEESEIPADTILGEIESGWRFKDKVLKPAKVRVSKGNN